MVKFSENSQIFDFKSWEYGSGEDNITFADMASTTACWEHSCNYEGENTTLSVKINGNLYECPSEGGIISVDAVGFVNCPKTSLLCDKILGKKNWFNFSY